MEAAIARPDLRLVDTATGEVTEVPAEIEMLRQQVAEAEAELRAKRSQITKLKNENARLMGVEPEAESIIEVLEFWRLRCMPGASIVPGSERWLKVRDRLREHDVTTKQPAHSVVKLKAAIAGVLLSDWHVKNKKVDAVTIFRDSKTVEDHVARAVDFKRRKGVSALTLLDELAGPGLEWLADRCSCGDLRMAHLMGRGCGEFDEFNAKVERHLAGAA